jgi:hypothetical protein
LQRCPARSTHTSAKSTSASSPGRSSCGTIPSRCRRPAFACISTCGRRFADVVTDRGVRGVLEVVPSGQPLLDPQLMVCCLLHRRRKVLVQHRVDETLHRLQHALPGGDFFRLSGAGCRRAFLTVFRDTRSFWPRPGPRSPGSAACPDRIRAYSHSRDLCNTVS